MTDNPQLAALLAACHWIGEKGWCPATGGNMSLRLDDSQCLITESGKDKGSLTEADFLRVETANNHVPSGRTPSAETGLHTLIYRLYPQIGAVLHTHSVNATVLSRVERSEALVLQGYEMQKSLGGQSSHLDSVTIPIFDNDQDIPRLAARVAAYAETTPLRYGFLVRGHGLYCWGRQVAEARRHLEGLEFLFQCELQRRLLEAK
ncbi:Methylthioribulose-1-phosphate dehydratase [Serratia entomophila]|uniref:methylthioribulose 1-phosphate dehydratase n=1 Tax=Serratia entomophila TaxID=42906 RepID=UPI00217B9125|nr:methylthioribulose 1-phosphate dehydratase [Serratia entomophila]CAI0950865.1 Methylthioribulose-1-phosphate dehydratase [Serratia entomophila]CAI0987333.1 Methylthioribulose-1-phosphate dehydratase [Serratia entomophila]CAI1689922.1 Methylthioribulose-1-phosphate dehydratase [Serratia entomophila]CAI1865068.1 Methylthioribulose-1-phosphate dehydratase [Serratia entomophila]CAI1868823.1 Methylthioribulose-1-phosphate dehydratase [Serratia entomophila]